MKDKFIRKWMMIAKSMAEIENPCSSRQVGAVIVRDNRILGTGYNGPPAGVPHPDTPWHLDNIVRPILEPRVDCSTLLTDCAGKGCPRRTLKIKSGEHLNLCGCQHAERNAITNAAQDLKDSTMFCWCGVPCWDCAGAIINAKISTIVCIREEQDYSVHSRQWFEFKNIKLIEKDLEWILQKS